MGPTEVMAGQSAELRAQVNTQSPALEVPPPPEKPKKVFPTPGERLRAKLLGGKGREQWIDVDDPDTGEVDRCLLVAPNVRQANNLITKNLKLPKGKDLEDLNASDISIDNAELQVQALILCLRDPDSRLPLLDQTHREALLDGPLTYLFMKLGMAAAQLCNPNAKKAKKNSSEIPDESQS